MQSLLAGSRTPFLQWLSFPAVVLLSSSISPFQQWLFLPFRQWLLPDGAPLQRPGQQKLPDSYPPRCRHPLRHGTHGQQLRHGAPPSKSFPMVFRHGTPGQQMLRHSAASLQTLCHGAPASKSFPMALRHGAPASNKPHPAEKSTPVWLAIWRTWAGFANSQHRDATFTTPNNIYVRILLCCHIGLLLRHSKSFGPSAPIAYATSVSPPDEAIA